MIQREAPIIRRVYNKVLSLVLGLPGWLTSESVPDALANAPKSREKSLANSHDPVSGAHYDRFKTLTYSCTYGSRALS